MLHWLPYLLDHLNMFINKFHSNNVALGTPITYPLTAVYSEDNILCVVA